MDADETTPEDEAATTPGDDTGDAGETGDGASPPGDDPAAVTANDPAAVTAAKPAGDPAAFTADDARTDDAPRYSVRLVGCAPNVRARVLTAVGGEAAEAGAPTLDLVVVSTRTAPAEAVDAIREGVSARVPVAVLAHPGVGARALELLASGATAVVHEGHEQALVALVDDPAATPAHAGLVQRFAATLGPVSDGFQRSVAVDPDSGLPGRAAFDERLEELVRAGKTPTVMGLRLPELTAATRRMAPRATALLLRRLAAAWRAVLAHDADRLYRTGDEAFTVLDVRSEPAVLAPRLVRAGRRYSPAGRPLAVGVGVAGPEDVTDPHAIAAVADGAAKLSAEHGGRLRDATAVAEATADSGALSGLLEAVARAEEADRHQPGHGERVARYAVAIGRRLGLAGPALESLRVAAHVHDVGKVAIDGRTAGGPDGLEGEALESYRSHPSRGASMVRPLAGDEVAAAIRSHHEAWDGGGFPDGLEGEDIPLAARVIAVADAWDMATSAGRDRGAGSAEDAARRLQEAAGDAYDPAVVTAAVGALAPHVEVREPSTADA